MRIPFLFLVTILVTLFIGGFQPASAAEGYGYFSCDVNKGENHIFVTTRPARYAYTPPPPPKDNSAKAMVDYNFDETDAFRKAHEADTRRFLAAVKKHYGAPCVLEEGSKKKAIFIFWGPFRTKDEANQGIMTQDMIQQMGADTMKRKYRRETLTFK